MKNNLVYLPKSVTDEFFMTPILTYGRDSDGCKRLFLIIHGLNFFNVSYKLFMKNSLYTYDINNKSFEKHKLHRKLLGITNIQNFQHLANVLTNRYNLSLFSGMGISIDKIYVINCCSGHFNGAVSSSGIPFIPYTESVGMTCLKYLGLTRSGIVPDEAANFIYDEYHVNRLNVIIHNSVNQIYQCVKRNGSCDLYKITSELSFRDFILIKDKQQVYFEIKHKYRVGSAYVFTGRPEQEEVKKLENFLLL